MPGSKMASRLNPDHLGAFGEFLEKNGYETIQPIGDYEVLRAMNVRKGVPPILVFRSERRPVYTVGHTGKEMLDKFDEECRIQKKENDEFDEESRKLTVMEVMDGLDQLHKKGSGKPENLKLLAAGAMRLISERIMGP